MNIHDIELPPLSNINVGGKDCKQVWFTASEVDELRIAAIKQVVLQSPEIQRLREERDTLYNELSDLIRGYVNLLESGRDRIRDFGGDCDPVDAMESNDPWLRSARKAINAMEKQT